LEGSATLALLPSFASQNFLDDLAMVLGIAGLVTVIFDAFGQPIVVGYLVAGMIVGPHVPVPLFANSERIHEMSNLGVVLLMFAIGLEFNVRKLLRLAPTAGLITVIQVSLMLWLGYMCGDLLGWTTLESVFVGATISISSTTIVAKAFADEKVEEHLKEIVMGVLLAEDITAVLMLAVLTAIASGASVSPALLGTTLMQLGVFLLVIVGAGFLFVPWFIRLVARQGREEILLVASVGVCFIFAILAEKSGYSVALGAFLAGSLVAESGEQSRIEHLVAPLRDVFAAVFFVSVGMMVNPGDIANHWLALAVLTMAVIVGKLISVATGAMLVGSGVRNSVRAGMSLAQIGEFSFIIAGLGVSKGATRDFVYSLAVALSAITTFSTPFMIRASGRVADFCSLRMPRSIQRFVTLYGAGLEPIREEWQRERRRAKRARGPAVKVVVAALFFAAIVIGLSTEMPRIAPIVAARFKLDAKTARLLIKLVVAALCAMLALVITRYTHQVAEVLARQTVDIAGVGGEGRDQVAGVTAMIHATVLLMVVLLLLVFVQPFMQPVDGLVMLVAAFALLAAVAWRGVKGARRNAFDIARALSTSLAKRRVDRDSAGPVERKLKGLGTLTEVRVPAGSPILGRKLSELDLPGITGAMVVAIVRDKKGLIAPEEDVVLHEGDLLELVGPRAAIADTLKIISGPEKDVPSASYE
jgi:CPA2 family monovalent cation:H+ antiporter-2